VLTLHQTILAGLTAVLALALAVALRGPIAAGDRNRRLALWGIAGVALALRLCVVKATFVHSNLHGPALLDNVLDFPRPVTFRAAYGQYGFFALGELAHVFGRSFAVVAAINQVVAAVSLGVAALMARRIAGTWVAAWSTLACGAIFVPLARIAASEDVHNLATLLSLLGLWGLDVYATERRRAGLVAAVAALLLMFDTRQTLYAVAPCAIGIALARGDRRLWRDRSMQVAVAAIALGLALRVAITVGDRDDSTSLILMWRILTNAAAIPPILEHHPLLDVARFGPVMPALVAAGLWAGSRLRGGAGASALSLVGLFVLTLPFGFPTPGVEYSFRTPALALALVVAGVGAAFVAERSKIFLRERAPYVTVIGVVALSAAGPLLAGWRDFDRIAPEDVELRFLQAAAPTLPHEFTWLTMPGSRMGPSYHPPAETIERTGRVVHVVDSIAQAREARGPVLFVLGVQCGARGLMDLVGQGGVNPRDVAPDGLQRFGPVVFGRAPLASVIAPPQGPRQECLDAIAQGEPLGPGEVLADPADDIPFVVYPRDMPLRIYRIAP
jgi:hypothetical protein